MKEALRKLGIVGPRHYTHLLERVRKAEARAEKLAQDAGDAQKALRDAKEESARHAHRVEKLKVDLDRLKADFERKHDEDRRGLAQMEQQRATAVDGFADRLAGAERELADARDVLMAIDVKLAILEGAANVLDARSRATGGAAARGVGV